MPDKRAKKLVCKYFKWWVHWLGLGYWDMTLVFSDKKVNQGDGYSRAGYCECQWKYLTATVTIYPKAIKHLSEYEIERVVIHELVHVLINEMREAGIDHEERVVTQLQKAFNWVKESNA